SGPDFGGKLPRRKSGYQTGRTRVAAWYCEGAKRSREGRQPVDGVTGPERIRNMPEKSGGEGIFRGVARSTHWGLLTSNNRDTPLHDLSAIAALSENEGCQSPFE